MNMKQMIQRMTDIETGNRKQLMEACVGSMPAPEMNPGTPVSINVSLNASGKEHVQDLINMMKNAGLGGAQPVAPAMMPMRLDIEKFRDTVDNPKGLGEEFTEKLDDFVNSNKPNFKVDEYSDDWDTASEEFVTRVKTAGHKVTDVNNEASPVIVAMSGEEPVAWYDFENITGFIKPVGESYANEPDEKYDDHNTMLKDLSGGLNGSKRMFKKAQDGDNPMAVESIKARLYALLAEKKDKPDFLDLDGDGDTKEPMKKAAGEKSKGLSAKQKKLPPGLQKAIAAKSVKEEKSSTGGEIDRSTKGVTKHKEDPNRYSDEPHAEPASKVKSQSAADKASARAADKKQAKDSKDYEKARGPGSVTRVKDGKKT